MAGETDLGVHEVFESRLSCGGVDLVLSGGGELGSEGVVEGHRVVEVSQLGTVGLLLPLPYIYVCEGGGREGGRKRGIDIDCIS